MNTEKRADLLRNADWNDLFPRLLKFADRRMWLSTLGRSKIPSINSRDALWFVTTAYEKILDGTRNWDDEKIGLYEMMCGAIWSLINSEFKKDVKFKFAKPQALDGKYSDQIDLIEDITTPHPDRICNALLAEEQRVFIEKLRDLLPTEEMQIVFMALEEGYTKPRDIEQVTGISARRIDQVKRNIRDTARRLMKTNEELAINADLRKVPQ